MYKVFYAPGESGGTGSVSIPDVSTNELTDKDILNSGDDDGNADGNEENDEESDLSSGDGESEDEEGSEEIDEENEEDSDEEEGDSESEESDGTGDEDVEDDDIEASGDLARSVKKVSPDLFKKVPGLREALERDKQYGELFSTPEEAKIAARDSGYLRAMYNDIISGDIDKTGNFLKAIKGTNEEGFEDFAHTFLESVGRINPNLYGEVMLKPIKKALMAMYADALKSGNKNLAAVAIHAHNYWFDTQDIKAPLEDRKKSVKSKEQEDWEKEKAQFQDEQTTQFRGAITEIVNHSMKLSITKELDGIRLDDYQKRNIIRDIFQGVDEILGADKRYLTGIQSLFDQAKSAKYASDWKSRIVKTYLQRARQALPAVRNKVLREAGIKVKDSQKPESRRLVPAGLGGNRSDDKIDFSRVDRSRTTDMDILNGKPKYLDKK